ncbi:hypothetical protein ACFV0O_27205 [Kitasatospora sp. NPDC059577]|uniref:hypothetical protein n=1 Tax=unclassified Kitasatospora TaxID=2633591 RepID=UPI0036BA0CCD
MLVFCQPRETDVRPPLSDAGIEPYRAPDWVAGKAVTARSGYVLAPGDCAGALRLSYQELSCAEEIEAAFHDRMREELNRSGLLVAEQIDASRACNVGVRVKGVRELTSADTALLLAARTGHLHQQGTRWTGVDPDAKLRTRLVPDLILTGLVERGPDGFAELTAAGAAVLIPPADLAG